MPGTDTLLLDRSTGDLVIDANGDIAVASAPYSLAQDAASAIKCFQGECTWDTTIGVPYLTQIFAGNPSIAQVKALFEAAAASVPGVSSVQVFISSADDRIISGQVQVTSAATGQVSAPVPFSVVNPQGDGQ